MLKVKLTSAMREEKDTAKKSNMILEKSNMKSNMILEKSSIKNEQLIIETIKANPSAPIPIFQKITGLSRSGIWKILNRLRENEVVRRIGSDRDGYWEIVEKSEMEGTLKSKKKNKNGIANDTVNSTENGTENGTENALENDTVNDRMDNEKKLLFAIIEHPNYTYEQYAELIHISRRTIARMLKNLHENGIIRRVGPDKGGHWEVIGNEQCTIDNEQ